MERISDKNSLLYKMKYINSKDSEYFPKEKIVSNKTERYS